MKRYQQLLLEVILKKREKLHRCSSMVVKCVCVRACAHATRLQNFLLVYVPV